MQELNRSTNSRMAALSLLSFVVTMSVAGLQLWHLKSFLERKKLLWSNLLLLLLLTDFDVFCLASYTYLTNQ